ncbi:hypothetical protein B0H19DRAFT_1084999 [Mycena capillaripes]|nr:hypothetical protein B0H19DRAFT_1084999 [Mycena capillaripes]
MHFNTLLISIIFRAVLTAGMTLPAAIEAEKCQRKLLFDEPGRVLLWSQGRVAVASTPTLAVDAPTRHATFSRRKAYFKPGSKLINVHVYGIRWENKVWAAELDHRDYQRITDYRPYGKLIFEIPPKNEDVPAEPHMGSGWRFKAEIPLAAPRGSSVQQEATSVSAVTISNMVTAVLGYVYHEFPGYSLPFIAMTMTSCMTFESLGEDVILQTLSLCDVYAVLSVSMVNKFLRRIALVKQLWLSLVHDLGARGVLDLPPGELNHSTSELVSLVKRKPVPWSILGCPWSQTSLASTTAGHRFTFETGMVAGHIGIHRLLPGAKYIVFQISDEEFHIYEVWSGRKVFTHAVRAHSDIQIDLAPDGSIARVFFAYVADGVNIAVHEVKVATGQLREVFNFQVVAGLGRLMSIVDNFLLYSPNPLDTQTLVLVNWRISIFRDFRFHCKKSSFFPYPNFLTLPRQFPITLLPGYIAFTYPDSEFPHQLNLLVTDLASFAPYWKPLDGILLDDQLYVQDMPLVAHARLECNGHPVVDSPHYLGLGAMPSALHQGAYDISVHVGECDVRPPLGSQMRDVVPRKRRPVALAPAFGPVAISYRLTPPMAPGKPRGWRLISAARTESAIRLLEQPPRGTVVAREESTFIVSYYK